MIRWAVDRIVHFDFQRDIVKSGLAHFGFYDRQGRLCQGSGPWTSTGRNSLLLLRFVMNAKLSTV